MLVSLCLLALLGLVSKARRGPGARARDLRRVTIVIPDAGGGGFERWEPRSHGARERYPRRPQTTRGRGRETDGSRRPGVRRFRRRLAAYPVRRAAGYFRHARLPRSSTRSSTHPERPSETLVFALGGRALRMAGGSSGTRTRPGAPRALGRTREEGRFRRARPGSLEIVRGTRRDSITERDGLYPRWRTSAGKRSRRSANPSAAPSRSGRRS